MIPVDLKPLVTALLAKARRGEVNWVAAADLRLGGENNDAVVSFADYSINIYAGASDDGDEFIAFNLLDSKGKRVHGFALSPDDHDFAVLRELLDLAMRKINRLDEVISKLEDLIRQEGAIGALSPKRVRNVGETDSP